MLILLWKTGKIKSIINEESGKLVAITVDHAIARGVVTGLENIQETVRKVAEGNLML